MNVATYRELLYKKDYDKILEISSYNVYELNKHTYLGKTILEHLLMNNKHSVRMDQYMLKNDNWLKLYLKYNIMEPLLYCCLKTLLTYDNNELLLEKILKKLNKEQQEKLFINMKTDDYFQYLINESLIINLFNKYGYKIKKKFIGVPTILDSKEITVNDEINKLFDEFRETFNDTDTYTIETIINEFKRMIKFNKTNTINEIKILINYKKKKKFFKIKTLNVHIYDSDEIGLYSKSNNLLTIGQYRHGTFNHELSHLLYEEYDLIKLKRKYNYQYNTSRYDLTDDDINNIINYLKFTRINYEHTKNMLKDLYKTNIINKYGSVDNYKKMIIDDLKELNLFTVTVDCIGNTKYITEDNLEECATELIVGERYYYIINILKNFYTEERYLENLLDAILDGKICDNKYDIKSFSGHSSNYYRINSTRSFEEVICNYVTIKNSYRKERLINKLRELVGDELVDIIEEYVRKRNKLEKDYVKKLNI